MRAHLIASFVAVLMLTGVAVAESFEDGMAAFDLGDFAEAARIFRLLAEQGNPHALYRLCLIYSAGVNGVPQDDAEAAKWCQSAVAPLRLLAEQGDADAQNDLGTIYAQGWGVPPDLAEAAKWYGLAAEQGQAQAQGHLGHMYFFGRGVPRDSALSYMWYSLAFDDPEFADLVGGQEVLDTLARGMTAEQLVEAERLAQARKSGDRPTARRAEPPLYSPSAPAEMLDLSAISTSNDGELIVPKSVHVGLNHDCFLDEDGILYCWNVILQDKVRYEVKRIGEIPRLISIELREYFDCGIDIAHAAWCWGEGFKEDNETYEPVRIEKIPGMPAVGAIAVGWVHVCAVGKTGAVWCWGGNAGGELGTGDTINHWEAAQHVQELPEAVAIGAGINNSCAVTGAGQAYCWGTDDPGSPGPTGKPFVFESKLPVKITGAEELVAVENGSNFVCAIDTKGGVVCWGSNIMGQLGAGMTSGGVFRQNFSGPVRSLDASYFNACASIEDGSVLCWGAWEDQNLSTAHAVVGIVDAVQISVDSDRACIVNKSHEIWCWGKR
ncbi:MAG: hypothetical protein GY798_04355 [Hyphomicrobiales bacterium]|nr:hypothetical protein [Hyphomicrobiales bacterium]